MRYFLALALLTALAMPAYAQDETLAAEAAPAQPQDDASLRTDLATQMHKIWPVSTRVEEAIDVVAEGIADKDREAFKARMRKAIDQKTLEADSIAAMAKTFTADELKAMIAFYGSPEGKSVSAKTEDYMKALQPSMVKMLDGAMMKMRTGEPLQSTPQ